MPASPGVFCSAHKGFHWQKGAWKLKLWCIFQVRESGRGCNTCRWQLEISHSLVVILSSCSWSNSQCLFMWFFDYLCFIRTFSVIPVVAIIPSGKMDPENVCLADSAVSDWYSSLCSTLTEPKTTCDQSVAGTNACRSQSMRKQLSRGPGMVFLWYLMWKQRFCILSLV